ncbi:general transcription factor IIIA [Microdochium nivale]|nr:general transcription factor IIIA [Microdochium nivale]
MAPTISTRPRITRRSATMSGGAIAGAVVGGLIGAAILALVLGFVYFRIRRKIRESAAKAAKASSIGQPQTKRRATVSFSGPGYSAHPYAPPLPGCALLPEEATSHPNDGDGDRMSDSLKESESTPSADRSAASGPSSVAPAAIPTAEFPSEEAGGFSAASNRDDGTQHQPDQPINPQAANASYYDTSISLESDLPAPGPTSPTAEMSAIYEEQIAESRRRAKKTDSGSSVKRFWGTLMKGRQSTQSSNAGSRGIDTPSGYGSRTGTGLESVQGAELQNAQNLHFPGSRQIFDEPEDIGDFVAPGAVGGHAQTPTGRSPIDVAPQTRARRMGTEAQQLARINSWRKDSRIRETTEVDPELPSAVYGSRFGSTDSYYGGGFPHSAAPAPPAAQPPHPDRSEPEPERAQRLKSPEIPEPVYDDESNGMLASPQAVATSSSSPSPPHTSENFVRPMHVMQPTTSTEKYYHTDYRLENPASPVTAPAVSSSPEMASPGMYHAGGYNYTMSSEHPNMDLMDEFLDIPGYDEPRRSSESYDYSVSMGPSSTDPSSGRTPDTRITMSPSPFPLHFQQAQLVPAADYSSSASPEATQQLSPPNSGNLICEECGRAFDQIHKLNHHKRYHDRKHECPYQSCDKRFGTKTHLDRHINDKHLKSKAFHCTEPGCAYFKGGKAFPRKDNWRRHMVKKHGANQQTFDAMDEGMD